jgi:hypothetical protein
MYTRTEDAKSLTHLLHDQEFREACGIQHVVDQIGVFLSDPLADKTIAAMVLHYVAAKGVSQLAVNVLLRTRHHESSTPMSCVQGDLTTGVNIALGMCHDLELVLHEVIPDHFTTNLSGLIISKEGCLG